jgi:hypothetical protein
MPQEAIPFVNNQSSSWESLGGASPAAHNILVDGRGTIRRRPGITTYDGAPNASVDAGGIIGLHQSETGELYAVADSATPSRQIYRVKPAGSVSISGVAGSRDLRGTGRPVFAETEALVVIAGGQEVQKIILATNELPARRQPAAGDAHCSAGRAVAGEQHH